MEGDAQDRSPRRPATGAGGQADLGALLRAGRFAEAEVVCRRWLEQRPDLAVAHNTLANVLEELGRLDEAEAAYGRAIALRADYAEAHYNLGRLLQGRRRLEEAEAAYARALTLRPTLVQAHNNRGAALRDLRRLDEAMAAFEAAVRLRPDYADAQFNQAMCRLMRGDFAGGWAQYEWRWRTRQADVARRDFAQPLWLGGEDLAGTTSCCTPNRASATPCSSAATPAVAERGARVVLEAPAGAWSGCCGAWPASSAVVARGQPLPPFDLPCPLMSLPLAWSRRRAIRPPRRPICAPIRRAVAAWRDAWRDRRACASAWSGPAARGPTSRPPPGRPPALLPLDGLAPLAGVAGISFVQPAEGRAGRSSAARPRAGMRLPISPTSWATSPTPPPWSPMLDLVISVDTAVAHLAGAMGKPVWILNRFDSCWRWLAGRDDSPWYPSARLFRQDAPGDWPGVIARVAGALGELSRPAR